MKFPNESPITQIAKSQPFPLKHDQTMQTFLVLSDTILLSPLSLNISHLLLTASLFFFFSTQPRTNRRGRLVCLSDHVN